MRALQCALGAVLLGSGIIKVFDPFAATSHLSGLLGCGARTSELLILALAAAEVGLGGLLLLGRMLRFAVGGSLLLCGGFGLFHAFGLLAGASTTQCGCFGRFVALGHAVGSCLAAVLVSGCTWTWVAMRQGRTR